MFNNDKKLVVLYGRLLSLRVGERALIYHLGKITRTGVVISIQTDARDYTQFETRAKRYCVLPVPDCAPEMRITAPTRYAPAAIEPVLPLCA